MNPALGICIGASTLSFVKTKNKEGKISVLETFSLAHGGNPKKMIREYFQESDVSKFSIAVTGRKFKDLMNANSISEPLAIEQALEYLNLQGKYDAIATIGGENFMVYTLNKKGHIESVLTGNKCGSGTGEFFLQQIRRMDLPLEESLKLAREKDPHFVSGRCSVFCKSDCTHALNKGVPKGEVVSGLSKMIANKIIELLRKQKGENILVIGGVSQNDSVIAFLQKDYPKAKMIPESVYFEALGASLYALADQSSFESRALFKDHEHQFAHFPALTNKENVTHKHIEKDMAQARDRCILGLDVGSTTTKAILLRVKDNALLASTYLRTNGAPVDASINCYKELQSQIDVPIEIIGLGTTGSGRHIAGLHALTEGVINEIIAHAKAAAYFDEEVDTIFEIGGQDAKYTYLTNGIASDYAMNEACSAGTGSFLEEAAKESLGIDYKEIGDIAFQAENPPNFNDQCAAFISSDIKNASQEGVKKEDIVAGLVYSICMNYMNRVKGNRPVGKKVFMQGGVCYNKSVPVAMSILLNKHIVVPPEPGLMGAFGVALEVKHRLELGLLKEKEFTLEALINRTFKHEKGFVCPGGKEKCDRGCNISMIEVEGKRYPFGGACSRHDNQRFHIETKTEDKDYVKMREKLVFEKYAAIPLGKGKRIGIPKTFTVNTLYPLYYNFFTKLGFEVVLADDVKQEGIDKIRSAFCYPVEISHGIFEDLLSKDVDYIFLPHVTELNNPHEKKHKKLCVFAQAETYYLQSAFSDEKLPKILSPVINFTYPDEQVKKVFVDMAVDLGKSKEDASLSFDFAESVQNMMLSEFKELGRQAIESIENDPNGFGMVVFGRPYNAFAKEANMGIPHKFASKGITIIPHDFLSAEKYPSYEHMYWYNGQIIMRNSRYVKDHPKLFGVYITNFSCGPDSFLISYFRKIMGIKPSLTLELDSHTADVGVNTRIDAALDIFRNYLELTKGGVLRDPDLPIKPINIIKRGKKQYSKNQHGEELPLHSNNLEIAIPSMGKFGTQILSSVFKSVGVNAVPMPLPTQDTLKLGRAHTSCKECLPFILTTGQMLEYMMREDRDENKHTLFFMPYCSGPCRQGQYYVKMKDTIENLGIKNAGIYSLDDEKSYGGLGVRFFRKVWASVIISDTMQNIENAIRVMAEDPEHALEVLQEEWQKVLMQIEQGNMRKVYDQLDRLGKRLLHIPKRIALKDAKIISLIGEVFVRKEEFSRVDLVETLAKHDFVLQVAPLAEYFYYANYLNVSHNHLRSKSLRDKLVTAIKGFYIEHVEKKVLGKLSQSGFVKNHMVEIQKTIDYGTHLISKDLFGEALLTVGTGLREIIHDACGVISIGPFACMPSRVAEAILNKEMNMKGKKKSDASFKKDLDLDALPYLHIETDGNAYPQITQSKIEIFMMQAERLHERVLDFPPKTMLNT